MAKESRTEDSFCEILLIGKKGQILEQKDILQRFNVDYANKVFFLQPQIILSEGPPGSVLFLNLNSGQTKRSDLLLDVLAS